ncbi:LSU ribosomal protein L1P [Methanothermus fervidus DSM 2088]|uniref:Large ribosomal subunit protein uL1 n=1 Tax=Methanothermus fervidus (strain ATCC 43054 / DSM 2088 / JCM 10308 / V24 S) TaxID=523846 RepID=E3GXB5_METFV|nr:50S ribosomal protein L1 [Methanothermus fervidus]ADP76947.1 LSU ribosomal protein L1P [Methanothermus fervidus DSM 2088]
MDNDNIVNAIKEAKKISKKRNFKESMDLIVNLKDVDVSDPEKRFNEEVVLPKGRGKKIKIAVIADGELAINAKNAGADLVIDKEMLEELGKNRRKAKKIAKKYEFFLAQADLMPRVGRFLGPVLGPRNKMPKPVPPNVDIEPIIKRLRNTVRIRVKDQPVVHTVVGTRDMDSEDLAENVKAVLNAIKRNLEKGESQIGSVYIKTTMGPTVKVM